MHFKVESIQVNNAVEVIDPETDRWTPAIITSFPDNTVMVRYPGWARERSTREVNHRDVREPTTLLQKCRRCPENGVNFFKLERGDVVHLPFEGKIVVKIVEPFKNEVVVLLEGGSNGTTDTDDLQSWLPISHGSLAGKRSRQPSHQRNGGRRHASLKLEMTNKTTFTKYPTRKHT